MNDDGICIYWYGDGADADRTEQKKRQHFYIDQIHVHYL